MDPEPGVCPNGIVDAAAAARNLAPDPKDDAGTTVAKSWGLVNAIGKVQEWTSDGETPQVRGGHYADDTGRCSVAQVSGHSGQTDPYAGFRLTQEIGG
jgi:hypothetical protein